MYPVIHLFGINLYPYGLMIGIGVASAIFLFMKRSKEAKYNEDSAFNMALIAVVSGIVGAKVLFIIVEFPSIIDDPLVIIRDFRNGFVFYGGIIGGILAAYIYIRKKRWTFMKVLDLAVPAIPLAHGFGRMGCFFAGCCYGKETELFLGMEFNNSPFAPHHVHLIPTQLISSIGNFMIFGILLWYDSKKKKRNGQTGALYLILYSIFRFTVEFFRGDPRGGVFNILSTSQFICIFVLAAGVIMFSIVSKKQYRESTIQSSGQTIGEDNQIEAAESGDKDLLSESQQNDKGTVNESPIKD